MIIRLQAASSLTLTILMIAGLFCLVMIVVTTLKRLWESEPRDTWLRYREQLENDRVWWNCMEGPGCEWPDNCSPGDCRRVIDDDEVRSVRDARRDS